MCVTPVKIFTEDHPAMHNQRVTEHGKVELDGAAQGSENTFAQKSMVL